MTKVHAFAVVLVLCFGCVLPLPLDDNIEVVSGDDNSGSETFQHSEYVQADETGRYAFAFSNPLHSRTEERDQDGNVRGSFKYYSPSGVDVEGSYVANAEDGFQIIRNDLPAAPVDFPQSVEEEPHVAQAKIHHQQLQAQLNAQHRLHGDDDQYEPPVVVVQRTAPDEDVVEPSQFIGGFSPKSQEQLSYLAPGYIDSKVKGVVLVNEDYYGGLSDRHQVNLENALGVDNADDDSIILNSVPTVRRGPPSYAKCVNFTNTSPHTVIVTVTYADEDGEIHRQSTIQPGADDYFSQLDRTKPNKKYRTVMPVSYVTVEGPVGEESGFDSYEFPIIVTGVHNCVHRNITVDEDGVFHLEGGEGGEVGSAARARVTMDNDDLPVHPQRPDDLPVQGRSILSAEHRSVGVSLDHEIADDDSSEYKPSGFSYFINYQAPYHQPLSYPLIPIPNRKSALNHVYQRPIYPHYLQHFPVPAPQFLPQTPITQDVPQKPLTKSQLTPETTLTKSHVQHMPESPLTKKAAANGPVVFYPGNVPLSEFATSIGARPVAAVHDQKQSPVQKSAESQDPQKAPVFVYSPNHAAVRNYSPFSHPGYGFITY